MFVHLHCHDHYSTLDGACITENLVKRAAELGMPAVAQTNHGNMFGTWDFLKCCEKHKVKPIVGVEAYEAPISRKLKEKDDDFPHYFHMVLLSKNKTGYRNLIKLVSRSFSEGFYYKPRIDIDLLREYHEGLIMSSACMRGRLPWLLARQRVREAIEYTNVYKEIFGDDFYIELMAINMPGQKELNIMLNDLAKTLSIKTIATNDSHFVKAEEHMLHENIMAASTGGSKHMNVLSIDANDLYFKSEEDMKRDIGNEFLDAIENTIEVANKVNFSIRDLDNHIHLPKYPKLEGKNERDFLADLAREGLKNKNLLSAKYIEQLEYELEVIDAMGFNNYFLMVRDIILWAKSQRIPTGAARGSAAGCLVSYAVGITQVDPIKYKLIFERFLNPGRIGSIELDI